MMRGIVETVGSPVTIYFIIQAGSLVVLVENCDLFKSETRRIVPLSISA